MTRVKICGITNKDEIFFLNRYLPDYAGFVFAKSRRRLEPEYAAGLAAWLSPAVKRVGVFVDEEPGTVAGVAEKVGLDVIQLHGNEDGGYVRLLRAALKPGTEIWKAIRMGAPDMPVCAPHENTDGVLNAACAARLESVGADRLLLDTYVAGCPGGTGRTFDWTLAAFLARLTRIPVIIAGGLHPENVRQAIEAASPFAVDASSGVESGGVKDREKVKAFIEAARG